VKDQTVTVNQESDSNENGIKSSNKNFSLILFITASILILVGIQIFIFYNIYSPRVASANDKMVAFTAEKARGDMQRNIQQQYSALSLSVKGVTGVARQLDDLFEVLTQHFRESPLETSLEVRTQLLTIQVTLQEKLQSDTPDGVTSEMIDEITLLVKNLDRLREIYTVPFEQLQNQLQNSPWYLWPTAGVLVKTSGYLNAAIFNRAIYLAQIGEMGTARVLLTGLHGAADDQKLLGLIFYGLGRLQWELFLTRSDPENYFQAVKFLQQSMQSDPDSELAKRLFDYFKSLSQSEGSPGEGSGEPTVPTEGEAGAVTDRAPIF